VSTGPVKPAPVFLGYCLKEHAPPPAWHGDSRVRDIACVTTCNLPRPEGWVDRWDFNEAGYYATPQLAEAALTEPGQRGQFALFAYEFFPLRFDRAGNAARIPVDKVFGATFTPPSSKGLDTSFEFLGYDTVERWCGAEDSADGPRELGGGFGCSPLFCNNCSKDHPVNEHCLLSTWDDAVHAARRFGIEQPEPGTYYIFGVYRAKAAAP
jgi:hypothetical protein